MGGRGAVAAGVAVWAGILLGLRLGVLPAWTLLVAAAVLAWVAWGAPPRTGTAAALLALALAGGARGAGHEAVLRVARERLAANGPFHRVGGRVVEPPPREGGEPVAVLAVERARPPLPRGTRLRLRLPPGSAAEWGDALDAVARVEVPRGPRNPGGFDARAAAGASAVAGTGRALTAVARPRPLPGGWQRATVARWRRAVERRLDAALSPETRELVVPLVVGDRSGLSTAMAADLRASGLVHLLALSGLHVVWLASIARGAVASLGGGVGPRAVAAALCAALYVGLAGPLPSLMRAAAHECLMTAATLRGRALDPVQALALSALGLLAVAPGWACDLGFQLSYAATLGLATLGPWLTERAGRRRAAAGLVVPTLAAQATALPLLLARFHAVSWVGVLSNLVAVPVSGLLLATAWLGALAEAALPGAGGPWFSAAEVLAAVLRGAAVATARFPGALAAAGGEAGVAWCAALGVGLLVVALPRPRALDARARGEPEWRAGARVLGALLTLAALLGVATARPLAPPAGRAWLVALDVGQGDALALAFGREWWLVDAGPRAPGFDAGESTVLPFLRWAGVRRLAWLVLTHDDSDHAGGAAAVRRATAVARVGVGPRHRRAGAAAGARVLARGDTLRRAPVVRVLWPPRDGPPAGDNAGSLVLEAGTGRGRLLLLADVDGAVEDSLAVAGEAAALKVAHHGAASATGAGLLARTRPRLALLSVGARNRFGHPAPAVLARLAAAGVAVRRTDESGAIWLEWWAGGVTERDWRRGGPPARRGPAPAVPPRTPRRR
jgi:competence protein ComEC